MSYISLIALICAIVGFAGIIIITVDVLKERKQAKFRWNSSVLKIYSKLSPEAQSTMDASYDKLVELAAALELTAGAMAKIHGLTKESELEDLIDITAAKLNRTAIMKATWEKQLRAVTKLVDLEFETEEDVTEFLEEIPEEDEEEIIELTELVEEKKPLTHRRWGEVCAPKVPVKPMAPRRWGQVRMMSSVK